MQTACTLDARALLRLMWLASPALPVGGFSYSEVLESAVDTGLVRNENQARAWLLDQLDLALARADLAVVAQAFEAWCTLHDEPENGDTDTAATPSERIVVVSEKSLDPAGPSPARQAALSARIEALNSWVRTTRESSELRQQTEQMGRSLLDWLRTQEVARLAAAEGEITDPRLAVLAALRPAPTWPVAHALALALTGAPQREALLAHGFGWAENMVQAALKTVPLGQSAGQRILAALVDALPAAVDTALALGDEDRQAHTPMLAILSAQHEAQYSRLFRS